MSSRYMNAAYYCRNKQMANRLNYEIAHLIFSGNVVLDDKGEVDIELTSLSRERLKDVYHQSVSSDELKRAVFAYQYVYDMPYEGAKELLACFHAIFSGVISPAKRIGYEAWKPEAIQYYIQYYAERPDLLTNVYLTLSISERVDKAKNEKANQSGIWHRYFEKTPWESLYVNAASRDSSVTIHRRAKFKAVSSSIKPSDLISIAIVNGDLAALKGLLSDINLVEKATQSYLNASHSLRERYLEDDRFKASMILHSTLIGSKENLYTSPIATAIRFGQVEVVKYLLAYAKEIAPHDYLQHIDLIFHACHKDSFSVGYSINENIRHLLFFTCWEERVERGPQVANKWVMSHFDDCVRNPAILKQLIHEYKKLIHFLFILERKQELADTKKTFIQFLCRAHEYYKNYYIGRNLVRLTGYEMARLVMHGEIDISEAGLNNVSTLSLRQQRALIAYGYLAGDNSQATDLMRQQLNKLLCEKINSRSSRDCWMSEAVLAYFELYKEYSPNHENSPNLLLEPMFLKAVGKLDQVEPQVTLGMFGRIGERVEAGCSVKAPIIRP